MICENCKKTQATVFYADESGGRHALCASCAKILGKISQYSPNEGEDKPKTRFIPKPTITSLIEPSPVPALYCSKNEKSGRAVCPFCATSLESAAKSGRVGCPECYTVFSEHLIPSSLSADSAEGARMPISRRESIERIRSIGELKKQLKIAVEAESYELAATLRDKIRTLEGNGRA